MTDSKLLWKNNYDWFWNKIAVMLFLLFLVSFPIELLCVYSVIGGLTMAAPMSHDTIRFNSNIFNNLRFLIK